MADVHLWLDELGIALIAPIEAVHERPWSTVLRLSTAEGDLYLKQCAPVQAFEVPLTVALASRWPDRLPDVVAADVPRAWLLLRDGGIRLRECGLGALPDALRLYAELQVNEAAHVDEFLCLGVPDVRLPVVTAAYEPFFERDHGLEHEELARLRAFASRYRELCDELDAFGLGESIQHDDLHDGNVFVRAGQELDARLDRVDVIRQPEHQVDGVEGGVAEARGRVGRNEATRGTTVEDVARRQVAVEKDRRRGFIGEPGCKPTSALVEL